MLPHYLEKLALELVIADVTARVCKHDFSDEHKILILKNGSFEGI